MTRTTPLRRMTLHFTQIFFTDARTFMGPPEMPSGRATAPEQTASLYRLAPHPDCRPRRLGPTRHQRGCVNSSGWAPCQHGAPEGAERVVEGVDAAPERRHCTRTSTSHAHQFGNEDEHL